MKISKANIFYIITTYFLLFLFVGIIFNVVQMAIAWSISIFIVLWLAFWYIVYCIDMYYYMKAHIELIMEELELNKKEDK